MQKFSQLSLNTSRVIASSVPNIVAVAMVVSQGKMQLSAFDGPSLKTPVRRENLLRKLSCSCPKFCCHGNGIGQGKMRLAAFDGPYPKTAYMRKNLPKSTYAS